MSVMRRRDREVMDQAEVEGIIARCQVCHLALASPQGQPYVVPLNFGYAAGERPALYFHCATAGRKLELIRENARGAFVLDRVLELVTGATACDWGMRYESVMGSGRIQVVSDAEERRFGLDRIMAQYGGTSLEYRPDTLGKTLVLKLWIEEMTGKRRE